MGGDVPQAQREGLGKRRDLMDEIGRDRGRKEWREGRRERQRVRERKRDRETEVEIYSLGLQFQEE